MGAIRGHGGSAGGRATGRSRVRLRLVHPTPLTLEHRRADDLLAAAMIGSFGLFLVVFAVVVFSRSLI